MSKLGSKVQDYLRVDGQAISAAVAGTSAGINVYMRDRLDDILVAVGTDTPADTTTGYAKGAIFIDTDVAGGTTGTYENTGTRTSCAFVSTTSGLTASAAEINAVCDGNTATAAEITRVCDSSERIVTIVETGNITEALHGDKICMLAEVGGNALVTLTLPEATGSGARFKFIVSVVNTSSYVIVTADTTNADLMGNFINQDADLVGTIAAIMYLAGATDDTITLNGTTTGGQLGDWIELIDVATDLWAVNGVGSCPAGSNTASPFSAAV